MYRFYSPAVVLRPYIENYWSLRLDATASTPLQEAIFVDGKADLLFNFGVPYGRSVVNHAQETVNVSNVDAQRLSPVAIVQAGAIHLLGVRFLAGGLSAFLRMPVSEISDRVIEVRSVFGHAAVVLENQLYDARETPDTQVLLLNHFFLSRLEPKSKTNMVQAMAKRFAEPGGASVQAIYRDFGYSARSIDRFFRALMGFSPKTYTQILRLQNVLKLMATDASLVEIALNTGYYDQSHFNHEFKVFTGQTPLQYRALLLNRKVDPAPNFVQFLQDSTLSAP